MSSAKFSKPALVFYCDGACSGNPGPGGWGVLGLLPAGPLEVCGGCLSTTNNQMELTATIKSLETFANFAKDFTCTILTDSLYVVKGINEWRRGWEAKGFPHASCKVKNLELWHQLFQLVDQFHPTVKWVKGHALNGPHKSGNDRADFLARQGIATLKTAR